MSSNNDFTHIGTATTVFEVGGVTFLTDPAFAPASTSYDVIYKEGRYGLTRVKDPALKLNQLPPIDAVLLSHEDHLDNLDDLGRQLLDGRRVITTMDGAKNLQPRPGVRGIRPWEALHLETGGNKFNVTGTPFKHMPLVEFTGFILEQALMASPTRSTSLVTLSTLAN